MPDKQKFLFRTRLLAPLFYAMVFCILSVAICTGQSSTSTNSSPGASSAGNANSQDQSRAAPERDPKAVQVLQSSVAKAGGAEAWSSVHGVEISGSVSSAAAQARTTQFQWVDDWSTGALRSYRTANEQSGAVTYVAKGAGPELVTINGKSATITPSPIIAKLALHVPAASMLMALNNSSYSIVIDAAHSTPGITCVLIRNPLPGPLGRTLMRWFISQSTGLPDHVDLAMASPQPTGRPMWETIRYRAFEQEGNLLLPSSVYVQHGYSAPTAVTIQSFQMNPAVTAQEFSGGSN